MSIRLYILTVIWCLERFENSKYTRKVKVLFYDVQKLKGSKSTQIFYKQDLIHINLREKTSQKYKAVQVSYFDPKKKKTIKATARNENVAKGDTLKITARCSDRKQATEDVPVTQSEKEISMNLEDGSYINANKESQTLTVAFSTMKLIGNIEHEGTFTNTAGIKSNADITDKTSSMQAMREIYNPHTHTGNQGSPTSAPNKTM